MLSYGKLCSLYYDATKKFAPEKEISFYASFIDQNPGRVLEAMSGTGRLQIPLLVRGYTVDGVDNSSIMLNRCRQRCAEHTVMPELYDQSLENLSLPHSYSTVTIAVGSFQLIVDRAVALQSLKNLRRHMVLGGNLLIDFFVPKQHEDDQIITVAHLGNNRSIRLTTRHIFYHHEQRVDAVCFYELIENGLVIEKEDELIQITWYSDEELANLLANAGFQSISIYEEQFRSSGPSRIIQAKAI